MKYIIQRRYNNVPEEVLLADLRKTAKKLGKKHVGYEEYEEEGNFCPQTFTKKFGSWNAALIKAGLKVKKVNRVSNDELLKNLKRVWDTLGRQPSSMEMVKPLSLYNRTAYKRRFGTWYDTLSAMVKAVKAGKFKTSKKLKGIKQNKPVKESNVSKSLRFDVFKRDNFKCRLCGASPANDSKVKLHVDHIIPSSKGGETILSNLQTLCSDCNYGKGAKTMKAIKNYEL